MAGTAKIYACGHQVRHRTCGFCAMVVETRNTLLQSLMVGSTDFNFVSRCSSPEAFEYAKTIEGYIDNYSNGLDKLDKKYPVSGYFWNYNPNDRMVVLDKEWTSNDKSLNRQIDCVNGKHMLVKLTGTLYWCQNCGTVIKTRKQMEVSKRNPFNKVEKDNDEYYYPMSPHFLPKKKNK